MLTDQSSQAFITIKMLNKLLLDLSEFSSNILQSDIVITEHSTYPFRVILEFS